MPVGMTCMSQAGRGCRCKSVAHLLLSARISGMLRVVTGCELPMGSYQPRHLAFQPEIDLRLQPPNLAQCKLADGHELAVRPFRSSIRMT